MDRVTSYIIVLILANLLFWSWSGIEPIKVNKEQLKNNIKKAETDLKQRIYSDNWSRTARKALSNIRVSYPTEILDKLRSIANNKGFEITQAVNRGGIPSIISISGIGSYTAFGALLNELSRNIAVHVDMVSVEKTDEGIVNASLEASVKSNIWSQNRIEGEFPELGTMVMKYQGVGLRNLFGSYMPPSKPSMTRPNIKYLGYYSGQSTPTIILEERLRPVLIKVGEKTPGGSVLTEANNNQIKVTDKRGKIWIFKMKK